MLLNMGMKRTTRLRRLIESPDIFIMPGVQDALTAKIAEQTGFAAITCGGYASTAALLGAPDSSQLGLVELAEHYARINDAVDIPLFADGDTGFGNVSNVRRLVRTYERAGVAGLFIEDQVFPKRCGHMPGKAVVPVVDMVAKLQAALDARDDPDLVIMARTDALAVHGIDAAIERAQIYREVGVDLIFVEAPRTVVQMQRICSEIEAPCMANNIEGGLTPMLSATDLQTIGYAVVVFPCAINYVIAHAAQQLYATLLNSGTSLPLADSMLDFDTFNQLVGLSKWRDREQCDLDRAQQFLSRQANRFDPP